MSKYTCEICLKDFKKKFNLNQHKNKKYPCVRVDRLILDLHQAAPDLHQTAPDLHQVAPNL